MTRFAILTTSRFLSHRRKTPLPPARGLAPLAILLLVWQILGDPKSPFYPPPSRWVEALSRLWGSGSLRPAAETTVVVLVVSLALATLIGAALGLAAGLFVHVDRALGPLLEFLRSMPPAALVPPAVLVIGYGVSTTVAIVVFASVWPVFLSTRSGVLRLNPLLHDVSRTLGLSRRHRTVKVFLPALVPSILLGMTLAAPLILILVLLVEILTATSGLGNLISLSQQSFDSAAVYGLVAVCGVIALAIAVAVATLRHAVHRYT